MACSALPRLRAGRFAQPGNDPPDNLLKVQTTERKQVPIMADVRLPMSAGAEASGVTADPRLQAPVDDEVTQVTQSGGQKAAPTVANSIAVQFGDTQGKAGADDFTTTAGKPVAEAPKAVVSQGIQKAAFVRDAHVAEAKNIEKKYVAKRAVFKEINDKKVAAKLVQKKDFNKKLAKNMMDKRLAFKGKLVSIGKKAQVKRAQGQERLNRADLQRSIQTAGIKNETKVSDVKATDVQNTQAVVDPAKKTQV